MPPRLHPRSRLTSSLFATTLFASFFVVVLPHALPCPAPRVAYADGEMADRAPGKRRKRRKTVVEEESDQRKNGEKNNHMQKVEAGMGVRKVKRECPVPKPGGLVGEILGFKRVYSSNDGKGERPP